MSERGQRRRVLFDLGYQYSLSLFNLLGVLIYNSRFADRPHPFSDAFYDSEEYDKWIRNQVDRLMGE